MKSYKYRLYPTVKQAHMLQGTLDHCREIYNAALQERRDAYEMRVRRHPNYYDESTRKRLASEVSIGYNQQAMQLPEIKVEHKAEWAGVNVSQVNPNKTSQMCSACHKEGKHKDLSVRTHICIHCGVVLDRDVNAAKNILDRGLGRSLREPVSSGTFQEAVA